MFDAIALVRGDRDEQLGSCGTMVSAICCGDSRTSTSRWGLAVRRRLECRVLRCQQGVGHELVSGLVDDAAAEAGLDLPVLRAARERFMAAADLGLTARDDSSVIETYRTTVAEGQIR